MSENTYAVFNEINLLSWKLIEVIYKRKYMAFYLISKFS